MCYIVCYQLLPFGCAVIANDALNLVLLRSAIPIKIHSIFDSEVRRIVADPNCL